MEEYYQIDLPELIEEKAVQAVPKIPPQPLPRLRIQRNYLVRYALTVLIIFPIVFFFSNIQAFSQISTARIKSFFGSASVIQDSPTPPQNDENIILPVEAIRDQEKLKTEIPSLNLELVPPDNRLIIPRISKNVPLIKTNSANFLQQKWDILDREILKDLVKGVVIYPNSIVPGRKGNTTITGHSSNYVWVNSKYNDVFARLHEVILGDRIYIYYDQTKYVYEVQNIKVVKPETVEVMFPESNYEKLTVITCTPVGTTLNRLVLEARRIN